MQKLLFCILIGLLSFSSSFSQSLGKIVTGIASYYGPGFHGRRTSSGEIFHMDSPTCAHKTYAFGTLLKVTNLTNNLTTIVRVNDRMPTYNHREIDLSRAAAKKIGMLRSGIARVELENLGLLKMENERRFAFLTKKTLPVITPTATEKNEPETLKEEKYVIQLAVFRVYTNLIKFRDYIKLQGFANVDTIVVKTKKETLYKIYLGLYRNEEEAQADMKKLEEKKIDAYLRKAE